MCGIAGLFKFDHAEITATQIRTMVDTLQHRGPDASAVYVSRNIGLGHTRLAILDLVPESNQPFRSRDGRYILTYNGEIFNYLELRQELEQLGTIFRTHSDTEVLLEAFIRWGPECVKKFNGMWAFAICDTQDGTLFCSRDRFGIKPFVYAVHDGFFVFASEAKAILELFPELRKPNYRSLAICLRQSLTAGLEETCFSGIKRLEPSHSLLVSKQGLKTEKYWEYPHEVNYQIAQSEAEAEIARLLSDSVRIRMRSDVPLGLTLSSGVDSTATAHLMREHSDLPIASFTSRYESKYQSEVATAESTSKALELNFCPVTCNGEDFIPLLRQVVRHIETPHFSSAMLPLWNIMSEAAPRVKVMLEGQGADELFAGYLTIYYGHAAKEALRQFNLVRFFSQIMGAYRVTHQHPLGSFYSTTSLLIRTFIPQSHKWIRRFGRGDESIYIGELRDVPDHFHPVEKRFADRLNRRLVTAHHIELVDLLHYGDAISMAHGIESRLPFMDYRLVEYAFQLPAHFKIINGKGKDILRRALRGIVPDTILQNQNKLGFVTPVSMWLRDAPEQNIYPILFTQKFADRGIFDIPKMKKLVSKHVAGKRDYGQLIFRWLTCELWFQEFIDQGSHMSEPASEKPEFASSAVV